MANNLVVSTGAADTIPTTQADFLAAAEESVNEARTALDDLSRRQYIRSYAPAAGDLPNYNINYNTPANRPIWSFQSNIPAFTSIPLNLNPVVKNDVDDFSGTPPAEVSPNIPNSPNIPRPAEPGLAPVVDDVTIPDAPILEDIADPKEWNITIPVAPIIDIPDFTGQPPTLDGITKPIGDFSWNEIPYDSDLLTNTVSLVERFNAGGVVIPEPIWEALWARDNDRENRAAEKLITEINEEWSSRGFQLPQGVQVSQIANARQEIQSTSSERSREIAIKEADLNLENLKFAVNQGIALENMRGGWYQQSLSRILDATKYSYQLSVEIYNAEISFYNSQLQTYQIEAVVYKTEIEAQIAILDVYKTELEGQKIIGDLNLQQVQIYKTKVDALNTEIALYNSTLAGIKIGVEIDLAQIQAYSQEVQAYGEKIRAISLEYDIYKTEMEGAQIESQIYDTNVKAYASRVSAYGTKVDAEAKNVQADISINNLLLEEYGTKLNTYNIQVAAAMEELKAQVSEFESKSKQYGLDTDNERSRTTVAIQELTQEISYAGQRTQASIAGAASDLDAAKAEAQLSVEGLKQVASIEGALAGSAMSAVHIGSSMADGASNSGSV
jgi:hypothetical protein